MPCYTIHLKDGGHAFLCGNLGPHCRDALVEADELFRDGLAAAIISFLKQPEKTDTEGRKDE